MSEVLDEDKNEWEILAWSMRKRHSGAATTSDLLVRSDVFHCSVVDRIEQSFF